MHGVSVHRSLLTEGLVSELRDRVDVVMSWPVDDPETLHRTLAMGVNGIISNEPEVLAAVAQDRDDHRRRD